MQNGRKLNTILRYDDYYFATPPYLLQKCEKIDL